MSQSCQFLHFFGKNISKSKHLSQTERLECDGANTSSAAAFIGSWTPNGPSDPVESGLENPTGASLAEDKSGNGGADDVHCLLVVETAEKSELICGQSIQRVENK
jgi:hypothetical protein